MEFLVATLDLTMPSKPQTSTTANTMTTLSKFLKNMLFLQIIQKRDRAGVSPNSKIIPPPPPAKNMGELKSNILKTLDLQYLVKKTQTILSEYIALGLSMFHVIRNLVMAVIQYIGNMHLS